MANTSPIKAIQNGLRKHNLTKSASEIREAAIALSLDIDSENSIEPLINHFSTTNQNTSLVVEGENNLVTRLSSDEEPKDEQPKKENSSMVYAEKFSLVAQQAEVMGITIAKSDIERVVDQVKFEKSNLAASLDRIKQALLAYVDKIGNEENQLVFETFKEIADRKNYHNSVNKEAIAQNLHSFADQMSSHGTDLKSTIDELLECIPV